MQNIDRDLEENPNYLTLDDALRRACPEWLESLSLQPGDESGDLSMGVDVNVRFPGRSLVSLTFVTPQCLTNALEQVDTFLSEYPVIGVPLLSLESILGGCRTYAERMGWFQPNQQPL